MDQSQLSRYKSLDFFARQVVEGFITGRHRSPFHGFSAEFSDYRQYNTGESTRNIDWRLFGRTDRLYIKQFEEETNLRCQLVIDNTRSMLFPLEGQGEIEYPSKLTFSVYAAATLIELLHRQRDAFGLTLLSPLNSQLSTPLHTPCRSTTAHQQYLYTQLEHLLQNNVDKLNVDKLISSRNNVSTYQHINLSTTLHLLAEQLHRRSLVVIFTDALQNVDKLNVDKLISSRNNVSTYQPINVSTEQDDLLDALRHLRHNNHEVILFHTFHRPHELQLLYQARPTRFVDLETGLSLKLNPAEIADTYRSLMEQQQADLQQHALQYHIDYIPVDVTQGFHQILLPFLLKRSKQP